MADPKSDSAASRFVWGPDDIVIISPGDVPAEDNIDLHPNQVFGKSASTTRVDYVRDDGDAAVVTNPSGTFLFDFTDDTYTIEKIESANEGLRGGDWHVPTEESELQYIAKQVQVAAIQKSRRDGA